MAKTPISLKLDSELLARLDAEANHRGQTRTTFVERAIAEELKTHWTAVRRNADGTVEPMGFTRMVSS